MSQKLNPFQQLLTRCAEAILHIAGQRNQSIEIPEKNTAISELTPEPASIPPTPETSAKKSLPRPLPPTPEEPSCAAQTSAARASAGRPLSPALSKAVALLEKNPDLSAADLAKAVKVSKDYGRTLLKRAKARISEIEAALPAKAEVVAPGYLEETVAVPPAGDFQAAFEELRRSLTETQQQVQQLAAVPLVAKPGMNLNRRAQVLKLSGKGLSAKEIASQLSVNIGEVDFILKVNQMILERY